MQKRILGRDGLEVSALGFGCMGISFGYAHPDPGALKYVPEVKVIHPRGRAQRRCACSERVIYGYLITSMWAR